MRRSFPGLSLAALALCLASACGFFHRSPAIFVPQMPNAQQQYALAENKQKDSLLVDANSDKYAPTMREITTTYQAVLDRFPDDRVYTPWAKIRLSELELEQGQPKAALKLAEGVMHDYGDLKAPDANARYLKGRILEKMGRTLEAQAAYRDCMERYQNSDDEIAKRTALECKSLYERVLAEK